MSALSFLFFTVLILLCRFYHCFYLIVRPCLPEKSKYAKALKSVFQRFSMSKDVSLHLFQVKLIVE